MSNVIDFTPYHAAKVLQEIQPKGGEENTVFIDKDGNKFDVDSETMKAIEDEINAAIMRDILGDNDE